MPLPGSSNRYAQRGSNPGLAMRQSLLTSPRFEPLCGQVFPDAEVRANRVDERPIYVKIASGDRELVNVRQRECVVLPPHPTTRAYPRRFECCARIVPRQTGAG